MNTDQQSLPLLFPEFKKTDLLETALTHRSALNEKNTVSPESNERLEFLGDAVLELCTTNYLYHRLPTEPEGMLTAYRSALVKTTTLAEIALALNVGVHLKMSRGEEAGGGRKNVSLLADTFEALLGALYLNQGYDAVYTFLETHLFPQFEIIKEKGLHRDFKSTFQEYVQAKGLPTPTYKVLKEVGPDHDKTFTVGIYVGETCYAEGEGSSKQRAEQKAAQLALEKITDK